MDGPQANGRPRYPALNQERRPAVAILGFTESRSLAPFGDPRFEIWGINELYQFMNVEQHGFTRWFEIHERKLVEADSKHIDTLKRFPIPVYMQQQHPDITPSVVFPKVEVEENCGTKYFTSSIAWMLGLALLEDFDEIHVYGVDMAQETEYFEQRPACEYLLGVAQGRGKKIYVPPSSDLLKAVGQYGWAEESDFRLKLNERIKWLEEQKVQHERAIAHMDGERAKAVAAVNSIVGALQDCTFWKRSWSVSNAVDPSKPFVDRKDDPRVPLGPLPAQQEGGDGNSPIRDRAEAAIA